MFLLDGSYELLELREGLAILRNQATGERVERRLIVNVYDGAVRIAPVDALAPETVRASAPR